MRNPGQGVEAVQKTESEVNASGANPNNYPLPVANYRSFWSTQNPADGSFNFEDFLDFVVKARSEFMTVNFRSYDTDPGDTIGSPSWLFTLYSAFKATHADSGASQLVYTAWTDATSRLKFYNNLVQEHTAFSTLGGYGIHPGVGSIDMGIGAYGENNYFSTKCTATSGTATCTLGAAIAMPGALSFQDYYNKWQSAFGDVLLVSPSDYQPMFAYATTFSNSGARGDCWGYKNNTTSCPSAGSQHCTLYPATFANGSYAGWQTAPTILETCGFLTPTWDGTCSGCTPYQVTASFQFAITYHAVEFNLKGKYNTFVSQVQNMLRQTAYRYFPTSVSHFPSVAAGASLTMNSHWQNHGNAPLYFNWPLMYKFQKVGGGPSVTYKVSTGQRARWLPGTTYNYAHSVSIPTYLTAGAYNVYVGIGSDVTIDGADNLVPEIFLPITTPQGGDLWYGPITNLSISNGSPTSKPVTDYAATLNGTSEWLELPTTPALYVGGKKVAITARSFMTAKAAIRPILSVGNRTSAGSLTLWLGYNNTSDRFEFKVSNGSTIYTVVANSLGSPSTSAWYNIVAWVDTSTHLINLQINNGATDTASYTGNLANITQPWRIGKDTGGNFFAGRIDKVRVKRNFLFSAAERTRFFTYNSNVGPAYDDLTQSEKWGTIIDQELDANGTNYHDSFQGWTFINNGGVTRGSSN